MKEGDLATVNDEKVEILEWNFRTDSFGGWAYVKSINDEFACLHKLIQPTKPT